MTTGRSTSENKLHVNYTTPSLPGSFTAVRNLKRYTDGESINSVKRYLLAQDAYTLHKQRRIHFPRRKTYSKGIADLYQADLVDDKHFALQRFLQFLQTIIDCLSKVAWVVPLLTKSADRVTDVFEKVLTSAPKCTMLQTDRGKEFLNEKFQSMLRRHNIHFYTSDNYDIKAAVVERFNRMLKTKMYKYFTFKNTLRYIDVLRDLVDSYNATYHRSIGMPPNDVNATNEQLVRSRLYPLKKTDRALAFRRRRYRAHREGALHTVRQKLQTTMDARTVPSPVSHTHRPTDVCAERHGWRTYKRQVLSL